MKGDILYSEGFDQLPPRNRIVRVQDLGADRVMVVIRTSAYFPGPPEGSRSEMAALFRRIADVLVPARTPEAPGAGGGDRTGAPGSLDLLVFARSALLLALHDCDGLSPKRLELLGLLGEADAAIRSCSGPASPSPPAAVEGLPEETLAELERLHRDASAPGQAQWIARAFFSGAMQRHLPALLADYRRLRARDAGGGGSLLDALRALHADPEVIAAAEEAERARRAAVEPKNGGAEP